MGFRAFGNEGWLRERGGPGKKTPNENDTSVTRRTPLKESFLTAEFWRSGIFMRSILITGAGLSILGATILIGIGGLHGLHKQLDTLDTEILPARIAGYEMEGNLLGSGLGVMKYLLGPDPRHRRRFDEDRQDFQHFLERFTVLSATDPDSAAAARQAAEWWVELQILGERLMSAKDVERSRLEHLRKEVENLGARIDGPDFADAVGTGDQLRLRADMSRIILQTAAYLEMSTPENLQSLTEAVTKLRFAWSSHNFPAAGSSDELMKIDLVLADVNNLVADHGKIHADLARFVDLTGQMNSLLDNRIQIRTGHNLEDARRETIEQIHRTLAWILLFAGPAGALVAAVIAVVVWDVIRPIKGMTAAADAYAQGDLSHRIAPGAIGELGTLSAAMNRMAQELDEARAGMAKANSDLEALVAQRTKAMENANRDLKAALDKAESANHAKSVFLANMSHEFRTPLNAVIGFAQIMREEMFGPLGAMQYKTYASDIYASGTHLLTLITDILDLSQMEAGELVLQYENVDLFRLIDECRNDYAERAEQADLQLQIAVESGLMMRVDRARLKQVVENLTDNAIKFTPPGGGVRIAANRNDSGAVAITVSDNGEGMDHSKIAAALETFVWPDAQLARKGGGAGLGLPLSKMLVEHMGASFHMESTPSIGTKVMLIFPAINMSQPA